MGEAAGDVAHWFYVQGDAFKVLMTETSSSGRIWPEGYKQHAEIRLTAATEVLSASMCTRGTRASLTNSKSSLDTMAAERRSVSSCRRGSGSSKALSTMGSTCEWRMGGDTWRGGMGVMETGRERGSEAKGRIPDDII